MPSVVDSSVAFSIASECASARVFASRESCVRCSSSSAAIMLVRRYQLLLNAGNRAIAVVARRLLLRSMLEPAAR